MLDLAIYPGGDLVSKGLADLAAGIASEEALLVDSAAPRLRQLGLDVPDGLGLAYPHHDLFERLEDRLPRGAHAAYNALIERIVSFANAYPAIREPMARRETMTAKTQRPETSSYSPP